MFLVGFSIGLDIQASCKNGNAVAGSLPNNRVKGEYVKPSTGLDLYDQRMKGKDSSQLFGYLCTKAVKPRLNVEWKLST